LRESEGRNVIKSESHQVVKSKDRSVATIERFEDIKAWQIFDDLRARAEEVAKALSGFITYMAPKSPM